MEGLNLNWLALVGACVGSFTNVVAWRLPREESVAFPGSHCPKCGHAIRWHDNLPLFGWLLLRGCCRDCGASISWRYPLWNPECWPMDVGDVGLARCWRGPA